MPDIENAKPFSQEFETQDKPDETQDKPDETQILVDASEQVRIRKKVVAIYS